ncbi:histidine kinase [Agrococcus sp. ARC_14]|uniref:sensor histidine kinase n=1 Tax=Agrococcus sp. ARC_14 TaxID=2919927 RepID=UPI001F06222D|nr:histidine kinase [Agrococcus sp. ARC_14]MCH1881496.1 histidine kinase [Agrococcus sp. ARC_14]
MPTRAARSLALTAPGRAPAGERPATGERMQAAERRPPERPRRLGLVLALLVAVTMLPVSVVALLQPAAGLTPSPAILAAVLVALAVLHTASVAAHRVPRTAFAVGTAAMLALALLPLAGGVAAAMLPSSLAFLLLIAHAAGSPNAAAGWGRLLRWGALAVGLAGSALITAVHLLRAGRDDPLVSLGELLGLAAMVSAAWLVGALDRARREQAAEAEDVRLRHAIDAERTRIGRDLHDVVSHSLTVMVAQAEAARLLAETEPARSIAAIERVASTGRDAMHGLRGMVRLLDDGGPAEREPTPGLAGLAALVAGTASPQHDTAFAERGQRRPLPPDAELALYRAVQEALTNAVRHVAPPVRIRVELVWGEADVVVTVLDDGGGGRASTREGAGTGLIGLAERLRQAGGDLAIWRDRGWSVRASLPIEAP